MKGPRIEASCYLVFFCLVSLYMYMCSDLHKHDEGGRVWVGPMATSKLLSSPSFPHQRKVHTEGLLGRHAMP